MADAPKKPPVPKAKTERFDSVDLVEEIAREAPRDDAPKAAATVIGVPAIEAPKADVPDKADAPRKSAIATMVGMPAAPVIPPEEPKPRDEEKPEPIVAPLGAPPSSFDPRRWVRDLLEGPRPRLVAFSAAGVLVLFVTIGVVVRLASGPSADANAPLAVSAPPSAPPPPVESAPPVVASASATPAPAIVTPPSCSLSGAARKIAPRALLGAGVELVAQGDQLAVGFASGAKEASVASVDLSKLVVTNDQKSEAPGPIKRVTPTANKPAIDVDLESDKIQGRRTVGDYDFGSSDGALVWAPRGSSEAKTLWKLEADKPAEAIRGVTTADGVAIVYRHNGAIWAGAVKGAAMEPVSPPARVAGLGPQLGSPTIAVSSGMALVAWADRASASEAWGVRWFVWRPGEDAKGASAFAPPTGGLGENNMSPSAAPLPGGFLFVWTEGPMSKQQVRAEVLSLDGAPVGAPMTLSTAGVHSGQGQAAALPDGRAAVAFLASTKNTNVFEVRAAFVACK